MKYHRRATDPETDFFIFAFFLFAVFYLTGCGGNEPGWWDYALMYTSDDGHVVAWDPAELPLKVNTFKRQDSARNAVDMVNDMLGRQFFVYDSDIEPNLVWLRQKLFAHAADDDGSVVGLTYADFDKRLHYLNDWYILLNEEAPEGQLTEQLIAHELGHVVGFGHDPEDCVTMSAILCEDAETRLNARQLELFHQVYDGM